MGNALAINVEIPLDKMVSCTCLRRTGSARQTFMSLQKDLEPRLRAAKKDVQDKITFQERHEMTMLGTVHQWLQQVETIQNEFHKLETQYLQLSSNKCFCPTKFKTIYSFGKDLANVKNEMVSLLERKPVEVAQQSLITSFAERPVEPSIGMHSVFNEAWRYMEGEKDGIIALHGLGGVGKTTLMKELHNKLCKFTQSFDVVLWIVISSTPSHLKVQNDIGSFLGFQSDKWKDKSQDDKAVDIYNILKQKKYVLFLDDVWQRIDLIKLGIPRPDQTNRSKIVLSTRSREVCGHMDVNKKIEVACLKEEEAWTLFREKVGESTINADPEIEEIAKLVAKECAGLPLALVVIGRAMASKTTPRAWNYALNRLRRNYSTEITGTEDQFLPQLKFSYDSLSDDSIRSCFLYCSLYPEDYLIDKQDIIDKWICEGFLDGFADLHESRNKGYAYIDTLVNASLLEESNPTKIKTHDIIREMAIWIGCECGDIKNKFLVHAGVGLTETPNLAGCEGSERMSLMRNKIDKLNGKPNFPNLVTLFLNKAELGHIDNEFFQSMGKLRVLDLSDNYNLREIPEEVCNLVTLQYLNLGYTVIPINLHKLINLINLKWLSIRSSTGSNLKQLPEGLLSSCKKLQVLDLYGNEDALPETFVEEIESLKHLSDLRITISSDVHLSRFSSSSHKLTRITTSLQVNHTASTNLDFLVSQKMMNLKNLDIQHCDQLEYVISTEIINNNYIKSLRRIQLDRCPKLKDITVLTFAPNLESIYTLHCFGMKELSGEWKWEHTTPFPKLKTLHLEDLKELERIYPNALPLFSCLKYMYIVQCPKLKKLPFNSSSCNSGRGVIIEGEDEWWNELEWEDEATRIAFHSFRILKW